MTEEAVTKEAGCYADAAFGHQHCREVLASVLEYYANENFSSRGTPVPQIDGRSVEDLVLELHGDMSDDAWEEYTAVDWLEEHVPFTDYSWGFCDGDFGLWPTEIKK